MQDAAMPKPLTSSYLNVKLLKSVQQQCFSFDLSCYIQRNRFKLQKGWNYCILWINIIIIKLVLGSRNLSQKACDFYCFEMTTWMTMSENILNKLSDENCLKWREKKIFILYIFWLPTLPMRWRFWQDWRLLANF